MKHWCTARVTVVLMMSTLLAVAGCSDEGGASPSGVMPSTVPTAAESDSTDPSRQSAPTEPTADDDSPEATAACLFTVDEVSAVLGGTWERKPVEGSPCAYTSDRGGVFVTSTIDQPVEPGLRAARQACLSGLDPIEVGDGGFVCIEEGDTEDRVVGNVGSRGELWLAVIVVPKGDLPEEQLRAMVALMGAVPT